MTLTRIYRYEYISALIETSKKEGNVLFIRALNTFLFTDIWRRSYSKGPLSRRERKPVISTSRLPFSISSKGYSKDIPRPLLH